MIAKNRNGLEAIVTAIFLIGMFFPWAMLFYDIGQWLITENFSYNWSATRLLITFLWPFAYGVLLAPIVNICIGN